MRGFNTTTKAMINSNTPAPITAKGINPPDNKLETLKLLKIRLMIVSQAETSGSGSGLGVGL